MPDTTPRLSLPYLLPAQAQKHVTVNEGLSRLDVWAQLSVHSATEAEQPSAAQNGDAYIVPPGKTGADWGPMADHALAILVDGAWLELRPADGVRAYVTDQATLLVYRAGAWSAPDAAMLGLGSAAEADIGTAGDAVPRLSDDVEITGTWTFANPVLVDAEPAYRVRVGDNEWQINCSGVTGGLYIRHEESETFPFHIFPGAPNGSLYLRSDGSLTAHDQVFVDPDGHVRLREYSVSELPTPVPPASTLAFVSDDPSGRLLAVSDGVVWRLIG